MLRKETRKHYLMTILASFIAVLKRFLTSSRQGLEILFHKLYGVLRYQIYESYLVTGKQTNK